MNGGYEVRPGRLDQGSRPRGILVGLGVVAFVALVVAKPWAAAEAPSASTPSPAVTRAAEAAATPWASVEGPLAATPPEPAWPALAPAPRQDGGRPSPTERLAARLVARAAGWSVGDGGDGPRLERDEGWVDWAATAAEPATDAPGRIVVWPGTGVCAELPSLEERPSFIAVSAPGALPSSARLTGWWSDGTRVVELGGSIRQITSARYPRVLFLERTDSRRWPSGRYEFHLDASGQTSALMVCL